MHGSYGSQGWQQPWLTRQEYLHNQMVLQQNQTNREENMLPLSAREGLALLQGLLLCGSCGHRLRTRYKGSGGIYPSYECNWKKREGIDNKCCCTFQAPSIDQIISQKVLTVLTSSQIDIALKAFEELEKRNQSLEKQWLMKIERATYDAQLAQRRYEDVDSSHRLVASTLEKEWNDALVSLQEVRTQYEEYQKKSILDVTKSQKDSILALAKDFPRLWNASTTSPKDRKRILRLLIKDITINKLKEEKKVTLHVRWQGGAVEILEVPLSLPTYEKWKHSDEIIEKVRDLALTLTDREIVAKFNQEGLITNKGNPFTLYSVEWIRWKHKIPASLPQPNELSINQVAEKFNVSHHVVRYWIKEKVLTARRMRQKFWVFLDPEKENELKNRAESSTKIGIARLRSKNKPAGGVV